MSTFATQPIPLHRPTLPETIRCLMDALPGADRSLINRIENQLTEAGSLALPSVLKGLSAPDAAIQGTCATVLTRWHAVEPVQEWAKRHPQKRWLAEQLLGLMGADLSTAEESTVTWLTPSNSVISTATSRKAVTV